MSKNRSPTSGLNVEETGSAETILEIENATVTFGMDRGESRVLDSVSIDVRRGEVLGIVGESGSGKSMLASALLDAVVEPGTLTGEITYYSEDGESHEVLSMTESELRSYRWSSVSMVFQGAMSSFNPTMTIEKHFEETLEAHNVPPEQGIVFARELIADLHLDPDRILDSYPHELSGGMKQRALIALSLVLEPEVLVMDEPTAALDLLMQQSILGLLEQIKKKYDLTIVFITHDLPLVAGVTDRLAVMYAFDLVEVGPTERMFERPTHPYTRSLLRTVPSLDMPIETMRPIDGSSPDPVNVPSGCSYHPRCPLADETCRTTEPEYHVMSSNHHSACFHWTESENAIPLETTDDADTTDETHPENQTNDVVVSMQDIDVHFEQSGGGVFDLFSDPEYVHAVDDVSLDVFENDVVALVGESGCGKTTLGKVAVGLQQPTNGSVEFRTEDVWDTKAKRGETEIPYTVIRRSLQIIHQDPGSALNPNQKVIRTLEAPLKRWYDDLHSRDRRARIYAMLERCGMEPPDDYAHRYPHQLSGGEKQRVALIRALLIGPDLILADEAVSALDVSLRVEMMDLMLELQDTFDTSYLSVSHDLSNARYFTTKADGRIGVMYLGELVEIGTPERLLNDPKHPYTDVLIWSTPALDPDAERGEPPVRGIDVPDAVKPPSGCRFHTRCPHARDVCTEQTPSLEQVGDEGEYAACFRNDEEHPYWESEELPEREIT